MKAGYNVIGLQVASCFWARSRESEGKNNIEVIYVLIYDDIASQTASWNQFAFCGTLKEKTNTAIR